MPDDQRRPTEEGCWDEFWTKMAVIWRSLPPEVQQECIDEAEEKKKRAGQQSRR